jgi:predicted TIM-barrel fold metal-dependent hydrolase
LAKDKRYVIVDFHAYLGRWPVYPLAIESASELVQGMDRVGVGASFVSNVEGVLTWNYQAANEQLARSVAAYRKRLLPVGIVNPVVPGWEAHIQVAIERWGLAGFRLCPNYHGYDLDMPEVASLANLLADRQLPLFVAAFLEDERFQAPSLRAAPVSIDSMIQLIQKVPRTLVVLNNLTPADALHLLCEPDLPLDNILIDVGAMDKEFDALRRVLSQCGSKHLVYGSQVPFLYPEAILALVQENGFSQEVVDDILERNWENHPVLTGQINSHLH